MQFLKPFGTPTGIADFKSRCEDFKVTEIGKFTPSGDGEHLWLWIEKTNQNTAWVAEELAKQSGIKLRDISYAGRKDKVAVTQQWFSLYDPKRITNDVVFNIPNVRVLESIRHTQKLRPGNLLGNIFEIRLRNFEGNYSNFKSKLENIKQQGFPNYFGPQRFGKKMSNLSKAIKWVDGGGARLRREQRSLYFSVLRSYLFNLVLSERIRQDSWDKIILGELAQLQGNQSVFLVNDENIETAQQRNNQFDINPTGPLAGNGNIQTQSVAYQIEEQIFEEHKRVSTFLDKNANAARRILRIRPSELTYTKEGSDIVLSFTLPAGSYATVFLDNLIDIRNI